jgi:hypothetical protein
MNSHRREALEVVTIGLPFCAFKILSGLVTLRVTPLGWSLIALGGTDIFINSVNFFALILGRPRVLPVCALQMAVSRGRGRSYDELGTSLDVFVAFALVAGMIAFEQLSQLPKTGLQVWNLAVVLNVLGAGIGRLYGSLEALKKAA